MVGARWRLDRAERIENLILEGVDFFDPTNTDPDVRIAKAILAKSGDGYARFERHVATARIHLPALLPRVASLAKIRARAHGGEINREKAQSFHEKVLKHSYNSAVPNNMQNEANFEADEDENGEAPMNKIEKKGNMGRQRTR